MSIAAPWRTVSRQVAGAARRGSQGWRSTAGSVPRSRSGAGARAAWAPNFHTTCPTRSSSKPTNPEPRENPSHEAKPPADVNFGRKQFADFDLKGRVFIVTGAARGLGLSLAEALVEAGGKVYCLDVFPEPDEDFIEARRRVVSEWGGSLEYRQQDVTEPESLNAQFDAIASRHGQLDGVIACAGIQQVTPAIEYTLEDMIKMMKDNYAGTFLTAQAAARQMFKHKCAGSVVLIASVSGTVANRGLLSPAYNSSKAAVVQLARNLAMEWSPTNKEDGTGGIRVNCISPGNILTPMVQRNFEEVPGLREEWESANMLGRLAEPHEFKGAALFLLSSASSFMTGGELIMDGGLRAW